MSEENIFVHNNFFKSVHKTKYKFVSERPGERFTSLSNSNLARKVLGYKPKHDLKKYIKLFIEKHRLN